MLNFFLAISNVVVNNKALDNELREHTNYCAPFVELIDMVYNHISKFQIQDIRSFVISLTCKSTYTHHIYFISLPLSLSYFPCLFVIKSPWIRVLSFATLDAFGGT